MGPFLSLLVTLLGLSNWQEQIPSTNLTSTAGNRCEKNNECSVSEICRPGADGVKSCVDPCSDGPCGRNALCSVKNHAVECNCHSGYTGDPFVKCEPKPQTRSSNSILQMLTKRAVGKKCEKNSDCGSTESCRTNAEKVKQCVDPCSDGPCGRNALCSVANHLPLCNCPSGYTGDPLVNCKPKAQTRSSKNSRREILTENVANWGHLTQRDTDAHTCLEDSECPANTVCRPDSLGLRKCLDEVISAHMGGCMEDACIQFCGAYGMKGSCDEVVDGGEKKCFCHK